MARRAPSRPARKRSGLSREHFRVAFENAHEALVIVQDSLVRLANPAASRLSAYAPEDLVGMPFLELLHPDDRAIAAERYADRLAGNVQERTLALRLVRQDGEILWVEVRSLPVDWRGRPAVLSFVGDVTDREQARQDAAEMGRLLERIAEVLPHFLFIYDYDLERDVYLNRSVPLALGYSAAEAAAFEPYPFLHLCHPDDLPAALDRDQRWQGVAEGATRVVEFRLRHRNGEWRTFRSHNTPFQRDAAGRIRQILGVARDVTDEKRAEDLLRRTERFESLGLLAGGIAHDFSNLLTPILGNVELLLARLPEGSPLAERALAIEGAVERASELARQLHVFAGRGEIERRPVDLNLLVEEVVHLQGALATTQVPTRLDLAAGLPPVTGDSSQLRQVILHLLTNARDALIDRPGQVELVTRRIDLDVSTLGTLVLAEGVEPGPAVLLEVSDEGAGMGDDTLSRIWEPFYSTKGRGRGLGLSAAFGILRAHRAGLGVESHIGQGSRFSIYFPVPRPAGPPDG